jgi:hypothetical protein
MNVLTDAIVVSPPSAFRALASTLSAVGACAAAVMTRKTTVAAVTNETSRRIGILDPGNPKMVVLVLCAGVLRLWIPRKDEKPVADVQGGVLIVLATYVSHGDTENTEHTF